MIEANIWPFNSPDETPRPSFSTPDPSATPTLDPTKTPKPTPTPTPVSVDVPTVVGQSEEIARELIEDSDLVARI